MILEVEPADGGWLEEERGGCCAVRPAPCLPWDRRNQSWRDTGFCSH